ncbi:MULTISPECIES: bifunctional alpha/beta hydrolase/OsmC family protein [unclassified Marinimicrobium]|jgi:putative redox protein|uniref:bifunctional alpha/beta hydrolase/OsmC family protein n=1 Tax=Marinimicrobium TaxID=359337 RepID=UPI000C3DEF15|nr:MULTISPECIES: bifunctional alpha/beta hydrolase/OsmC family protein [unclassified Marinimicrobium]MAN52113.1 osmotically inducible protein C [Marinimicrobium sp.]
MPRQKVEFTNADGHSLAGALELPDSGSPKAFALFAHCFTCGKDVIAATRIARTLADQGIAVLRFDFTGLGSSEGDFANTTFSSNVSDLEAAAKFLAEEHQAPALLIGHSLGGAAVLAVARRLKSVQAVVTIAAPASPKHVEHLFADQACDIRQEGRAPVTIAGRTFELGAELLEDLDNWPLEETVGALRKPLLIFHSPVDQVVNVDEAAKIFQAAKHPKSFVSLDDADHLLSDQSDADYVALTLAAWASRYLRLEPVQAQSHDRPSVEAGEVLITEQDAHFLRGLYTADHQWQADEPKDKGGSNQGPNPYDFLLMSLGACTSMTLRMYINHKELPVENLEVRLRHQRIHAEDCRDCETKDGMVSEIHRELSYEGSLSEEQHQRMLDIADKCPVHKTLKGEIRIRTTNTALDQ